MRYTYKPRLARAKGYQDVRRMFGAVKSPLPPGVTVSAATVGGVPGEWVEERGAAPGRPVLLYLHGGGYIACSPETHRPYSSYFALRGFRVFVPDYRLAPEHPFPAAVDDAVAVYHALLAEGADAARLTVAGDSAGGGLALSLLLRLKAEGAVLPAAAMLFSPLTDLASTGNSITANDARCAMFRGANIGKVAGFYLNGMPADDPIASPLYADLSGLPPLMIHVGADEVLLDDSTRLAERARAAGTKVEIKVWPVVPHVWQLVHRILPEGRQSMQEATAFLRRHIAADA